MLGNKNRKKYEIHTSTPSYQVQHRIYRAIDILFGGCFKRFFMYSNEVVLASV